VSLSPGVRVGPYEVTALIGEGGMGKVWRALHIALNRDDALKVLPDAFASDPDRLARFRREAQVLASLNHPNIAHIYGLEQADGVQALVMELVEGSTLADRIAQGPIPIDEALPIAKQIAEALEAAHEQGIIHRDLKPANIKVRPDGTVKVLDFGLAKLNDPNASNVPRGPNALSMSPTITSPAMMTGVGVLLGTAAYMSPEQAKGREADKRSDIWAFGCVLHDMLTGKRAFEGDEVSETLASVLAREPNWTALPTIVAPALHTLLRRCLVKDPRQRLQAIGEARIALERHLANPGAEPLSPTLRSRYPWLWPAVAAVSLLVALSVLGWTVLRPRPSLEVMRFEIQAPEGSTLPLGTPAFSPDGRTLAYTVTGPDHTTRIHVRSLDAIQSRVLAGTENAVHPFWSADGRSLAFATGGSAGSQLRRIELASGVVHALTDVTGPWHGTWNRNGMILFAARNAISEMSGEGGRATVVATPDEKRGEQGIGFPHFLSDGNRFLTRVTFSDGRAAIELATLGSAERTVVVSDSRSAPTVVRTPVGNTYLLYMRDSDLLAQAFDETSGKVLGKAVVVVNNIGRVANPDDLPTVGVSSTGLLAYQTDPGASGELAWFDRFGQRVRELPQVAIGESPALSPDGQFAAVQKRTASSSDIWLTDLVRGSSTRLTFSGGLATAPSWSPDGKRIAYHTIRSGKTGMYEIDANGNGQERLLTSSNDYPLSWSPDGKYLLYRGVNLSGSGPRLFLFSVAGDNQSIPVTSVNGASTSGAISPGGRSIAFSSTESGQSEIYVQSMPPATGKRAISVKGGNWPRWRRDGKELFFLSLDWKMMAADVDPVTAVVGVPHELFQTPLSFVSVRNGTAYDVSGDGQRFLMDSTGQTANAPITVILNWDQELKRLEPVK